MNIITLFSISLGGIIILFIFKQWENTNTPMWYRRQRERGDRAVTRILNFLYVIPHASRIFLVRVFHAIVFHISAWVLLVVRFLERRLFRFVNMVKGKREINHKKGSVSLFLTAISDKNR